MKLFGTFERVARIKGHEFEPRVRSPDGRFVAMRAGLTLQVVDLSPDAPQVVGRFKNATSTEMIQAFSPDGARIAIRHMAEGWLEVRSENAVVAHVQTATRRLDWRGRPVERFARPQWGFADEHLAFSADGRTIVLATHDLEGRAQVLLFDAGTLTQVDVLTDLRSYSPYATFGNGTAEHVALGHFSESWLAPESLEPSLLLGVANAGDSCKAVFGVSAKDGALVQVEPKAFQQAVFDVDAYLLRALRRVRDGLLVMTRDGQLARLPWPPRAGDIATCGLFDVKLPYAPYMTLEPDGQVGVDGDRLLVTVRSFSDEPTLGVLVVDTPSMTIAGVVEPPVQQGRPRPMQLLDGGVAAVAGATVTTLYRLRPSD